MLVHSKVVLQKSKDLILKGQAKMTVLSMRHGTAILFVVGVGLLAVGLEEVSRAQGTNVPGGTGTTGTGGIPTNFNDAEIKKAVCQLFRLTEGAFGALLMTTSGIGAIISAAFGGYRAATSMLVTGIGAFTLRSFVSLFFGAVDCSCAGSTAPGSVSVGTSTC